MDYLPIEIESEAEVKELVTKKNLRLLDLLPAQWKELFVIRHIGEIENKSGIESLDSFKEFCRSKAEAYKYFYYHWHNLLVKTVGADDFFTLKTNRNRDLITEEEQRQLSKFTVAVLGLSVGSNIAFLLTQTGIQSFGGRIGFVVLVGILAAITTNIPYWNWYGFPSNYTAAYMFTEIVGFLVVGIVAALLLPKPKH